MSLLTRKAPHTVYVQNRVSGRTPEGARGMVDVGDRIPVKCMHEPVRDWSSAEESASLGLQVLDLTIIRAKKWPGDVHSHIIIGTELFETVGAPQHHSVSPRTSHWRITVRRIGTDPKAAT